MKRRLVALVGLVVMSALVLFPVAPRGAWSLSAPGSADLLYMGDGWDWGGSGGS